VNIYLVKIGESRGSMVIRKEKMKFDLISLFVNDLKKMVHFYKEVIGIEIDWDRKATYAEFKH